MSERDTQIIVGVDGSKQGLMAARWAATVADRFGNTLRIVHAIPGRNYYLSGLPTADVVAASAHLEESAQRVLNAAESAIRSDFSDLHITTTTVVQLPGDPASKTLVDVSREARLFVVGCDEVGPAGALLVDSETLALSAHSRCPVVAWRGDAVAPDDRPVLVGVDDAGLGLASAFEFAYHFKAAVIAVRAWSYRSAPTTTAPLSMQWSNAEREQEQTLSDKLAPLRQRYPDIEVITDIQAVKPSRLLAQHAGDAQLVVLGRSHRGRLASALLGSTNLNLLHHSPTSVMICPSR